MSQSNKKETILATFSIGLTDELKNAFERFDMGVKKNCEAMEAYKNSRAAGGLLAVMQGEAANDAPKAELKQLGQWVFEGQDEKWQAATVTKENAWLHNLPLEQLYYEDHVWCAKDKTCDWALKLIDGNFDGSGSSIQRETVNDVDYLSGDLDESVPSINGMEASVIIVDELQSDWLSESVPQITQADMQLIFIKNLSECLIQRMHSMNRFSEDDYALGGDNLMAWDIVANPKGDFAVITGHNQDKRYFGGLYFVPHARGNHAKTVAGERASDYLKKLGFCTITEAELPAFRAALEACYA